MTSTFDEILQAIRWRVFNDPDNVLPPGFTCEVVVHEGEPPTIGITVFDTRGVLSSPEAFRQFTTGADDADTVRAKILAKINEYGNADNRPGEPFYTVNVRIDSGAEDIRATVAGAIEDPSSATPRSGEEPLTTWQTRAVIEALHKDGWSIVRKL